MEKNLVHQFDILMNKQLKISDSIKMMREIQVDLGKSMRTANAWGFTAVIANAALVPLNVIVNAFELKKANSLYQLAVRKVYDKFGKSGSRTDGASGEVLSMLKKAVIAELTIKGLTDYIPGVNIMVGLAEDSLALWDAVEAVDSGSQEMRQLAKNIEGKIASLNRELMKLGVQSSDILDRIRMYSRTA
jgi:hypothetical protein